MLRFEAKAPSPRIQSAWTAILCVIPLMIYFVYATWIAPRPVYARYDPEYQYMLNSLSPFKGEPYQYTDHPGTPVEVLGTALYAVTYPFVGKATETFIARQLENPGTFLRLARGLLLLLSSLSVVWLLATARAARSLEAGVWAAAVSLLYFALHPLSFYALTLWSHNSFSFALGTPVLVYVYRKLRTTAWQDDHRPKWLLVAGLAAGVLTSITVYLAAWLLGIMITVALLHIFRGISWKRLFAAEAMLALSGLSGFVLGVLPVIRKMPEFFEWVAAFITHRRPYLLANRELPQSTRLVTGFAELFSQMPELFIYAGLLIALAVLGLGLARRRARVLPEMAALVLGLAILMIVLTVLMLDHPKSIYMLSVAAALPVFTMAILDVVEAWPRVHRVLSVILGGVILVGVVVSLGRAITAQNSNVAAVAGIEQQTQESMLKHATSVGRDPADLVVLWAYRSYSPCFALWYGNDSAGRAFKKEIANLCPNQFEFNIWGNEVIGRAVRPLEDVPWDMIIACESAFHSAGLAAIPVKESFPRLQLDCGSLTIAYNQK